MYDHRTGIFLENLGIDFYKEFLLSLNERVEKLCSVLYADNIDEYRICVHSQKSASKNTGADQFSEKAKLLEKLPPGGTTRLYQEIRNLLF